MLKFLFHLLNIEALACVVLGLWIHEFGLIFAGLICFAITPMLKKELRDEDHAAGIHR